MLEPGELLAARYRAEHVVPGPGGATGAVWRARDEVLGRPVAVKLLPARDRASVALLEAAVAASAVDLPLLTRVYDAAVEPRRTGTSVVYVVSEWVDGTPLARTLVDGPFPVAQALAAGRELAAGLVALHDAGVAHGRLHPGNVLLTPAGRLRLTDTAVADALAGGDPDPAGDVRDLAALLYALLTGCWPADASPQPGRGLPEVAAASPPSRALRRAVPRALAAALPPSPSAATAAALLAQLDEAAVRLARARWRR